MKLVLISGLSGAGKSIAMHALEDLGYYCVDNLPVRLLGALADELDLGDDPEARAAVSIDSRNPAAALQDFPDQIKALKSRGLLHALVFLEADDASLIKRFSETRRKHPLTAVNTSLAEAIGLERSLLETVRDVADVHIDTSSTNLHQLRELITHRVHERQEKRLSLLFQSFGFKHGVPQDADMVFDARCLPNPHWVPGLRPLTGCDREVKEYLLSEPVVTEMVDGLKRFLEDWIPRFEAENRSYLTIAVGCTGGRHRSVFVTETLGEHFRAQRDAVLVRHRDMV